MSQPETTDVWPPDAQLTRYVASGQVVGRVLNSTRSTDPPQHGQQSPSSERSSAPVWCHGHGVAYFPPGRPA